MLRLTKHIKLPNENLILIIIFVFSLLLRLSFYHTEFWRSPDSIEYINVSRNLISGNGFTQSIKWHFFDPSPVITSALKGRPPLTYFSFAAILSIKNDPYAIQLFLLFLGAVNIVLFYKLASKFFTKEISFIASIVASLNPNLLITNRLDLSEGIFTFFVLIFFIIFFDKKKSLKTYILLGALPAISYLTRFEGFFLLPLILFLKPTKKNFAVSVISFLVLTLPYFYSNFLANGSPFYSYNTFHFRVFNITEGMWDGFGKSFPSSLVFVKENLLWIINTVSRITVYDFFSVVGLGSLSFLSFAYLVKPKEIFKKFAPFLIFSFLSFALLSMIWSGFTEPERHFSTIFLLLLIPTFILINTRFKKFFLIILGITLIFYIGLDAHRIYWAKVLEPKTDNYGMEDRVSEYSWIRENTSPNSIIASDNPWMTYLNTNRPSVIFSSNIEKRGQLDNFVKTYKVSYILNRGKLNRKLVFQQGENYIYCGISCN